MQEGHLVQFRLGFDSKLVVWVDEVLDSPYIPRERIVTNVYNIPQAIELQMKLINFGYEHLPALELMTKSGYSEN